MSGHNSQGTPSRCVRSSPKQGPLKATIPVSSLLKQNSNLKNTASPTVSPTSCWKRISPDHSSGQRSPGSSAYKVKSKTLGSVGSGCSTVIRRTASLDTIYLKGRWPRDNFYWCTGNLQIDKATQTEDIDWTDPRKITSICEGTEDKLDKKVIRQRIRSNKESNPRHGFIADNTLNSSAQTLTSCILSPTLKANPVNIPLKPLPKSSIRSSVEGLNQEIERLVLKTGTGGSHYSDRNEEYNKFSQVTPEGHRAPLAEIFRNTRSRSVNTQTPGAGEPTGSCHSSGPPSRASLSPLKMSHLGSSYDSGDSVGSSPDQESGRYGTSPHINRFLAREPPDGCEKVHLKAFEDRSKCSIPPMLEHVPQPCTFKLKPSLGSAFQILQPNLHLNSSTEQDLPLVPSQQDLI